MFPLSAAGLMLIAWALELLFGWPDWVYQRARHPVVWIGVLISKLEGFFNRLAYGYVVRYLFGVFVTCVVAGVTTGAAFFITRVLPDSLLGYFFEAAIASSLLASRSLYKHVKDVSDPLSRGELSEARVFVAKIVGRDPTKLDSAGVARASLETLAENASDGVVAPLFWGAIFGLPGLAAYKAINTLDSMIGHRSERYEAFGGFAARLDDVVNLIPARLTGGLIALASGRVHAFKVMVRQARQHRSPNAGWPEAAMAGGLNVRLSGPRYYGATLSEEPWLNPEGIDPHSQDIKRGLKLYVLALLPCALVLLLVSIVKFSL